MPSIPTTGPPRTPNRQPRPFSTGLPREHRPIPRRGTAIRVGLALLLALVSGLGAAPAAQFPDPPPNDRFYVDEAGLIAESEAREINDVATALWRDEQVPLFVVTIPSLVAQGAAGHTVERYARELFDAWKIGSERRNYGMLLLVSRGDRRARIELGAAWGLSHDLDAAQVMDTLILPEFRLDRYSEGILAGVRGLEAMARGLALPKPVQPWWAPLLPLGLLAVAIGVIVSLFRSGRSGWGWALIIALGTLLFFALRAAAQSSGSGGARGGGYSGGGGASGSW